MKTRIVCTFLIILLFFTFKTVYPIIRDSFEAQIAVTQLNDSVTNYSVARAIVRDDLIQKVFYFFLFLLIIFLWIKPIYNFLWSQKR